jgi:hypothetical protein
MSVNKFLPHYTTDFHCSSNIIRKVKQDKKGGVSRMHRISEMHKHFCSYKMTGIDDFKDLSINGKLKILK